MQEFFQAASCCERFFPHSFPLHDFWYFFLTPPPPTPVFILTERPPTLHPIVCWGGSFRDQQKEP